MPHKYIALTPQGKLTMLDAFAQSADGTDLVGQIHQIISAQHGPLGGITLRTINCPDAAIVINQIVDDDEVAAINAYAEGIVHAMDGSTESIRGTVVITAATPAGLNDWELTLLQSLYDSVASMM